MTDRTTSFLLPAKPKKARVHAIDYTDFDGMRVSLGSPAQVRSWSYGEVKKSETINYRTFKPERDGLFCERIFGPVRDYECSCGKFKWIKYKGQICDRCGVEVTESQVRRERMGHIELAVPVAHIWYVKKLPSRIATLLDMKQMDLERVIYYARYIVMDPGETPLEAGQLLTEEEYQKFRQAHRGKFKAGIGAAAVWKRLEDLDLEKMAKELRLESRDTKSDAARIRVVKRLRVVEGFLRSGVRPEWMILNVLPVIPPDLRPLVPLDGGRFATSDLNDLYRRIINRNNRLRHVQELRAPEVMIQNEKRLLQEAVDALIENGARGKPVVGAGNRPLKSLSDILKGKQGRFRQNLLGKRVDYSGRSVIVNGPTLKFNQCGLPKEMALELFKPFIIRELMEKGMATSLRSAKRMLERAGAPVWDILEQITRKHPVLLNRAPTLHRLGIQAFEPVLIEGKAIQLHPLTCTAFNADFDGDQMAVHVPLSVEAQLEARVLMLSPNNILSPAHGKPLCVPSQDIVLGCSYLTKMKAGDVGEGRVFASEGEAHLAADLGEVGLHARIKVRGINRIGGTDEDMKDPSTWKDYTSAGRVLFNESLPPELRFYNRPVTKRDLGQLIEAAYHRLGSARTVVFLDDIKRLGYRYATKSGLSISISAMTTPADKKERIVKAQKEVKEIEKQAKQGVITDVERYNKVIDIWTHVTDQIADTMFEEMKREDQASYQEGHAKFNPIYMMADSGARGGKPQIRQLAGMRGLMARPQKKLTGGVGEIIETPIIANFREGLTVLEYFISTHGGRKGLADTALKTADAGYLTRRLVDVAHDVVVRVKDCGTTNGIRIGSIQEGGEIIEPLSERVTGRVALDNVVGLIPDEHGEYREEVIIREGDVISEAQAQKIVKAGIEQIRIRSVLTCEAEFGVCGQCYGINPATGRMVDIGEAVGVIAAQSIGEPGTQLTLRTFHIGGTAARVVIEPVVRARHDGTVRFRYLKTVKDRKGDLIVVSRNAEVSITETGGKKARLQFALPYGARLVMEEGKKVKTGDPIAEWDPYTKPIISEADGEVRLEDVVEGVTMRMERNKVTGIEERIIIEHRTERLRPRATLIGKGGKHVASYPLPEDTNLMVNDGDLVSPGVILAKIPQEITKMKDITGGLPRVAELFEARKPRNAAVISEIDGACHLDMTTKGQHKVIVENETGLTREYIVPQGKHLVVYEGDRVRVGDPLTGGSVNPHDILRVKGPQEVQEYLVNEIQEVYRLQGVNINDRHIEIMVRQMLGMVRIEKSGDSPFLIGELANKFKFQRENEALTKAGKDPATARPILLGATKAALGSESFISAASFQETTRVLTEASVSGAVDQLRGLKENVIIGHLIPAGSGMREYREVAEAS